RPPARGAGRMALDRAARLASLAAHGLGARGRRPDRGDRASARPAGATVAPGGARRRPGSARPGGRARRSDRAAAAAGGHDRRWRGLALRLWPEATGPGAASGAGPLTRPRALAIGPASR